MQRAGAPLCSVRALCSLLVRLFSAVQGYWHRAPASSSVTPAETELLWYVWDTWVHRWFFPGQKNWGKKKWPVSPQLNLRNGYGEVVQDFIFLGHFPKLPNFFHSYGLCPWFMLGWTLTIWNRISENYPFAG